MVAVIVVDATIKAVVVIVVVSEVILIFQHFN